MMSRRVSVRFVAGPDWSSLKRLCALLLMLAAPLCAARAQQQGGPLVSAPPKPKASPTPASQQPSAPDGKAATTPAAPAQTNGATTTTNATAPAQNPLSQTQNNAATFSMQTDTRYRIGPGDVLEVRVTKAPELSREAVRVDQSGMIRMPMLDEDIRAACLTEGELAHEIATRYLKYKKNPHVDVFVKEFQSQPVAVIGAVNTPGQFKLQRQIRLLEILTFAGGQAERAGQTVQIVHAGGTPPCEQTPSANSSTGGEELASNFNSYKLSDTLRGVPDANPVLRPGDIINVLEADQVFVVGNVMKPSSIPMKEPITVSRAIAMAGGPAPDSKKERVRVIRQLPGSATKQEIYVDLRAIEKRKADDIALQANDIVDVPTSAGKSLLRSLLGTIAPTIGQLPVRVIP